MVRFENFKVVNKIFEFRIEFTIDLVLLREHRINLHLADVTGIFKTSKMGFWKIHVASENTFNWNLGSCISKFLHSNLLKYLKNIPVIISILDSMVNKLQSFISTFLYRKDMIAYSTYMVNLEANKLRFWVCKWYVKTRNSKNFFK